VATDKVKAFAKSAGIDVDTYLSGLEEQGFTQAQIDALSTRGSRGGSRVSVYDIGE
jgi:hypothetical protein